MRLKKSEDIVSQDKLQEIYSYNPDTGIFIRKIDGGGYKAGDIAGTNCHDYIKMSVLKKQYLAHRLVWLYVYGYYPIHTIDHINGIKTDNRICNLRDVSQRKNNTNKLAHRRGKLYGSYDKKSKKWGISISCKSVYINIRRFNSALSAHYAYIDIFNAIENEGDILGTVLKYTQTKRVPYITPIKTKWIARITQNGNRKTLGTYITKEEAALVYFNYYIRIRNTQPTKNALMELFMRQYDIENKPENIINLYRYI